jgi:hypothetical protein
MLNTRRRVADDLKVDPGRVHGGQPALAEIGEVGREWSARVGVGVAQGADRLGDRRRPEVVLEADDAHGAVSSRAAATMPRPGGT